jgi:hypothetical protein
MKRKYEILQRSTTYERVIGVDSEEREKIMKLLEGNSKYIKKFRYVVDKILEQPNMYFDDYKKIKTSHRETITEIRLFPNGDNCRIYCKEQLIEGTLHCVILAVLLEKKKSQKINKVIQQIINRIKNYEYELPS